VHSSYVGPGVDAAGLYVGMTRGRHSDTALTIARNRDQAVERLADTMMRGQLEVTLDDARTAAFRELGRAARTPSSATEDREARWDDQQRRPYGAIVDVDLELDRMGTVLEEVRRHLVERDQAVRASQSLWRRLDAIVATETATTHARVSAAPDSDHRARRIAAAAEVDADLRALEQASEDYRRAAGSATALTAEQLHRDQLGMGARETEDRERRIAAEAITVSPETVRSGLSR